MMFHLSIRVMVSIFFPFLFSLRRKFFTLGSGKRAKAMHDKKTNLQMTYSSSVYSG